MVLWNMVLLSILLGPGVDEAVLTALAKLSVDSVTSSVVHVSEKDRSVLLEPRHFQVISP